MHDTINRTRTVNVDELSDEQLEVIQQQLSSKITGIIDKACEDANKFLNVYGLQAKMQIVIQPIETNTGDK